MTTEAPPIFQGFEAFRANVTYTPRQFFTVVLPSVHSTPNAASRFSLETCGRCLVLWINYLTAVGVVPVALNP